MTASKEGRIIWSIMSNQTLEMIENELWVRSEYRNSDDDILCVQYQRFPLLELLEWLLRIVGRTIKNGTFRDRFWRRGLDARWRGHGFWVFNFGSTAAKLTATFREMNRKQEYEPSSCVASATKPLFSEDMEQNPEFCFTLKRLRRLNFLASLNWWFF